MIVLNKRLFRRLRRWVSKGNSMLCFTADGYQIVRKLSSLEIGKEYSLIQIMYGNTAVGLSIDTDTQLNWPLAAKKFKVDTFQQWADDARAEYEKELGRQQSNLVKKVLGVA